MKKAITAKELRVRKMLPVNVGDDDILYMRKPSAAFGMRFNALVKKLNLVDAQGKMKPEAEKDPEMQKQIIDAMNDYIASHVCDEEGEPIWESASDMLESDIDVWSRLTDALNELLGMVVKKPSDELAALVDDSTEVIENEIENWENITAEKAADVPLALTSSDAQSCESPITPSDE